MLKPLYVDTDHLGTFDNYNTRLKFPSQSSTLMKNPIRSGVSYFPGGNVYGGSLCFRVYFSLTVLPVSNKIKTSYIRLVSMCSLGTVLWLTLASASHLCSLNGVTVEINLCATCHIFALPSFAGQNSIATTISPSSLLSQLF